jgi:hypothetical protein
MAARIDWQSICHSPNPKKTDIFNDAAAARVVNQLRGVSDLILVVAWRLSARRPKQARSEVFHKLQAFKNPDGFHKLSRVLFAFGSKPTQ